MKKKNLSLRLFSNTSSGTGGKACVWFSYIQFIHFSFLLNLHKRETEKEGGKASEMEDFWAQCLSVSLATSTPFKPSAHAPQHKGTGSTLLMMVLRVIGYADHRRKPFCLALIPSGSFTFWGMEKNELKIKIISLILLHPRFMAAAFKGNWKKEEEKKTTAEFTSVPFLVFQYFINVTSKVNLWGH